jgi:hypothetical protein
VDLRSATEEPSRRYTNYYIFKVITLLLVIVAMSLSDFCITLKLFGALVESLGTTRLEHNAKSQTARRVDGWARAISPVLLLLLPWHSFL